MLEIGPTLRQAREGRGLQPLDVEADIRIRAKYLVALEEERFDALPLGYEKAFLRAYAECLGLNSQLLVEELATRLPPEEPLVPHPPPRLRLDWIPSRGPIALLAGLAVLLALLVAGQFGSGKRGEVAGLVAKPTRAPSTQAARTHAHRVAVQPARHGPKTTKLVLTAARGDCWILVRVGSRTGPTLYENTLAQGRTLTLARAGLWVRLGAPGNLDIRLNGRQVGRFSDNVPRNVLVTASGVRANS